MENSSRLVGDMAFRAWSKVVDVAFSSPTAGWTVKPEMMFRR